MVMWAAFLGIFALGLATGWFLREYWNGGDWR